MNLYFIYGDILFESRLEKEETLDVELLKNDKKVSDIQNKDTEISELQQKLIDEEKKKSSIGISILTLFVGLCGFILSTKHYMNENRKLLKYNKILKQKKQQLLNDCKGYEDIYYRNMKGSKKSKSIINNLKIAISIKDTMISDLKSAISIKDIKISDLEKTIFNNALSFIFDTQNQCLLNSKQILSNSPLNIKKSTLTYYEKIQSTYIDSRNVLMKLRSKLIYHFNRSRRLNRLNPELAIESNTKYTGYICRFNKFKQYIFTSLIRNIDIILDMQNQRTREITANDIDRNVCKTRLIDYLNNLQTSNIISHDDMVYLLDLYLGLFDLIITKCNPIIKYLKDMINNT